MAATMAVSRSASFRFSSASVAQPAVRASSAARAILMVAKPSSSLEYASSLTLMSASSCRRKLLASLHSRWDLSTTGTRLSFSGLRDLCMADHDLLSFSAQSACSSYMEKTASSFSPKRDRSNSTAPSLGFLTDLAVSSMDTVSVSFIDFTRSFLLPAASRSMTSTGGGGVDCIVCLRVSAATARSSRGSHVPWRPREMRAGDVLQSGDFFERTSSFPIDKGPMWIEPAGRRP
mmetsp:Transcript_45841/g.146238  ORF Transcript_45841/g.146238 Transcript_45841/m.146238 type:complete len:233 (-) Transcript_45841:2267-2965(-)